jgi:hypothetical protein
MGGERGGGVVSASPATRDHPADSGEFPFPFTTLAVVGGDMNRTHSDRCIADVWYDNIRTACIFPTYITHTHIYI